MRRPILVAGAVAVLLVLDMKVARPAPSERWSARDLPLRQSAPLPGLERAPLTLRDTARGDRWIGVGVRGARFAPDGRYVYFRWNSKPRPDEDPEADPWFRATRDGGAVERVAEEEVHAAPAAERSWQLGEFHGGSSEPISWSLAGDTAAWPTGGRVYAWDATRGTRLLFAGDETVRTVRLRPAGDVVHVLAGEELRAIDVRTGAAWTLARKHVLKSAESAGAGWLQDQQQRLLAALRERKEQEDAAAARDRRTSGPRATGIPLEAGFALENVQVSPDGHTLAFRARKRAEKRTPTLFADFVSRSGQTELRQARPKVGDPQDEFLTGLLPLDPSADPERAVVTWIRAPEAAGSGAIVHGPYWSLEGRRAVVQVVSANHQDRWISALDPADGETRVLHHDHDDAWLGGPPPVEGYDLGPALLEWLPGERFVFASEQTGYCHLYLMEPGGETRALTSGAWEVRAVTLSRDRRRFLIGAGREHPCDDHLYTLPATGGELVRLTQGEGRFQGALSPDGIRLLVVHSVSTALPDLFLTDAAPGAKQTRITQSGSEELTRHPLLRPEVVSFRHPDGKLVWGALYKPPRPHPSHAAVLHIHGGGYRQFSHRGYSVYGWAIHLGLLHWLVEQGVTVLDFDYRGSSGFGRDYRTDIYRSMGEKDVEGAVAAVDFLAREHGVDRTRVGLYGISYGGFFTLAALFRHPGVFAAGVANAAVTDWAHYEHDWTSRILGLPTTDPEAYRRSSPIEQVDGLRDPLLIVHGLVDDNVQFQDAARLVQKLIEREKDFEVAIYPVEPHTMATEASRYDYARRVAAFFERHLLAPR